MKLHAVMVTKNEMDRYIKHVLLALDEVVDCIWIYDDDSEDGLCKWLSDRARAGTSAQWYWTKRLLNDPTFLEDESRFRRGAYEWLEVCSGTNLIEITEDDWVLAIDADELLVQDYPGQLKELLAASSMSKHSLNVAEVFDVRNGVPMIRTDGFWGSIRQDRLFRWTGNYEMNDRPMACGSVPKWAMNAPLLSGPTILHYGYARYEDKVRKYGRYMAAGGHNRKHVDSILRQPTLMPWDGPTLEIVT